MGHIFPPNLVDDLRSIAHQDQSQIIGGDADENHTQIIGGDTVKLLGGVYPPGFGTPNGRYSLLCFGDYILQSNLVSR